MHLLTKRFQSINVATLCTLREHLKNISGPECGFKIEKVRSDRVTVSSECLVSGARSRPSVVLPAYPTGHQDDTPNNPNVVLDPIQFLNAETCAEREVFTPLLGKEVLAYYEKLHPHLGFSMNQCC